MSVVDDLSERISAGRIIFDSAQPGQAARLRRELLGQNAGTKVTRALQALILEVSGLQKIRISSIVRTGPSSHHVAGRAFDVGNEEIAGDLLPLIATDDRVEEMGIDEIIFDARVAGQANRNRWNYNAGRRHNYDAATLAAHNNHIHFAVRG
jgi:hypothetical protein